MWLADWFGSPVAVKTVIREHAENSEFKERFSSEIEIMARLHHPNIVMFIGASIEKKHMCLVCE